jgi:hypothetical protein
MKYFLDTEFIEYPYTIDLISIGIVDENGKEYYAVNSEFDGSKANDWVRKNVFPHLGHAKRKTKQEIALDIINFVPDSNRNHNHFWGYYGAYDWVVFCWLFGKMIDLPDRFPMYINDIRSYSQRLGNPHIPEQLSIEHNALNDAKWNKFAYEFLEKYESNIMR